MAQKRVLCCDLLHSEEGSRQFLFSIIDPLLNYMLISWVVTCLVTQICETHRGQKSTVLSPHLTGML